MVWESPQLWIVKVWFERVPEQDQLSKKGRWIRFFYFKFQSTLWFNVIECWLTSSKSCRTIPVHPRGGPLSLPYFPSGTRLMLYEKPRSSASFSNILIRNPSSWSPISVVLFPHPESFFHWTKGASWKW